ncbi:MAG: hypothetical protein A3G32_04740 [Deltaproteobacteria bacterium RIFCSPLOWO2_12_FULL_40_28]|nr:MAG: hypothetical protein A3C45_08850 [Deltaproteobacteria bacterium RIFCSPHIGHO2_02_FULL_40_28]OGQ19677.1 MAG: hypothetical protein A3E27_08045 [Deltaproteobacteria bacterium RIFCSPHIGHO2_12_FULL_40_32]OGQ40954.1 MAG: hypothetical protein A3I69_03460 [Deltaproteobacteria bacterium RIFCSPLOWO2_02_FULL_40_36]OGQ54069.1 MAG: hypothetical protein A3G32_04740 [Deltaproteobacteria bacterium RIFCSPLOWO2_12_FULL_40_28]
MKNNKGFTLLEVLIGVAILTGMSLLLYTTMGKALDAKERVERQEKILHSIRIGVNKMVEDLSQGFLVATALKGQNMAYETGLKGKENEIYFSTLSHRHFLMNTKDTDQVDVGYLLETSDRSVFKLIRTESNYLMEKVDAKVKGFPLVEQVKEFRLEYYDAQKEEWVPDWDSTGVSQLNRLPRAVKISLKVVEFEDEESEEVVREHFVTTMAEIPLYGTEINF